MVSVCFLQTKKSNKRKLTLAHSSPSFLRRLTQIFHRRRFDSRAKFLALLHILDCSANFSLWTFCHQCKFHFLSYTLITKIDRVFILFILFTHHNHIYSFSLPLSVFSRFLNRIFLLQIRFVFQTMLHEVFGLQPPQLIALSFIPT